MHSPPRQGHPYYGRPAGQGRIGVITRINGVMLSKSQELIPHVLEGEIIQQRGYDGYVNATAMCKAAGKLWGHYAANSNSQAFIEELSADIGIPISELIQSVKGGSPDRQGTWVHPQVAIHLAQWLSPRFAVQVAKWVSEWMRGDARRVALPYHLERYVMNFFNVPPGHFSVLTEMTQALIAPLELMGYTLPEKLWPDISEGKMFANWLREQGIEPKALPTYLHQFRDGRPSVRAKAYPEHLLGIFRWHFREVWLPKRAMDYFAERDQVALAYLPKLLPPPSRPVAIAAALSSRVTIAQTSTGQVR